MNITTQTHYRKTGSALKQQRFSAQPEQMADSVTLSRGKGPAIVRGAMIAGAGVLVGGIVTAMGAAPCHPGFATGSAVLPATVGYVSAGMAAEYAFGEEHNVVSGLSSMVGTLVGFGLSAAYSGLQMPPAVAIGVGIAAGAGTAALLHLTTKD